MARNVALVAFGIVVGVFGAAALQLHAADETGTGVDVDETLQPTDDTDESLAVTQPAPTPEPPPGIWDRLAACESSGDWASVSNPRYKGGLQMDAVFWSRYGGLAFAPRPDLASRAQQILVAERGLAVQGPGAWPVCGPRVGLHR